MTYNVAPEFLTIQPQRPVWVSKASSLAHGIGEVIVPHLGISLVRRLPYTVRGTGVRHIPTPAGVAVGLTAFTNNGGVFPLNWPHHGFRLTPPFTIGCLGYINSASGVALGDTYTSNNSGWRIRASGLQIIADVTRGGATVTLTDPSTITLGTVHAIMLVVTATTLALYVDGVQVATGSHSSYSAGNLTSVAVCGAMAGGSFSAGGVLQLTSWTRALTEGDARLWAAQPWSILEDEDDVWVSSDGASGTIAVTNADDTASASGTTTVVGTSATTNANDAGSASGTTTVVGTSSTTNANDTSSASGTVGGGADGTIDVTNENDTANASGWSGTVTGTIAVTNADDIASANGETPRSRRFAGSVNRRWYIIKGKKYYLTPDELAIKIALMLDDIKRSDIKVPSKGKIKPIPAVEYETVRAVAKRMDELASIYQENDEDEDEELLSLLL